VIRVQGEIEIVAVAMLDFSTGDTSMYLLLF
jgi:hypothetical protein